MPQLIFTVEEYIAEHRKKDSIWMVFNTRYNEIHALKKFPAEEEESGFGEFYDKQYTDNQAREAFLEFMKTHFPNTKLFDVFDSVSAHWLQWPYLGSIAIDADIGSDVYKALCEKYGDAYGDTIATNQTLWVMQYEDAKAMHHERTESIEAEFGEI
jgi:hypothetical protein